MLSLKLLFLIPLLGILLISISPLNLVKRLALATSIIAFIYTLILAIYFNPILQFQYLDTINIFNISLTLGIDGISLNFILLTGLILPICILTSIESIKILIKQYYISLLTIELILFLVFTVLDIVGFYIFYEAVLIPMFLIIGVWGARKEKITAAYYFFFYTLVGSILMLLSIIYIYNTYGTTDYLTLLGYKIDIDTQKWLFLGFFASFAVKIPKFPFHIWLPLAHVEAPLAGSILLAAILIKLGSYGIIRFALPLFPEACLYFSPLVNTMAILAIIYASLTTLRQTDLKRIIAYSSVSHMGVVMLGIFSFTQPGIEGSIFLQIAHGLVSSALFIIVTILYDRHHSRIVKYYRGVVLTMPLYSLFFFIFTLANIGVPLSCNFIGEFLSLFGIYYNNPIIGILGSLGMVLSGGYALFLFNRVVFGTMSPYIKNSPDNRDITRREIYILTPLLILTIFLGIFPDYILYLIHNNIISILSTFL